MYDTILFPTDGSDGAQVALAHARDIATTYDATIHVLYVADSENQLSHLVMQDDPSVQTGMIKPDDIEQDSGLIQEADDGMTRLEAAGELLVTETADKLAEAGVEAHAQVRRGDPYRTIQNYAEEEAVDLIVMPTHGRRGVDRYLLGSVTEKIVRTADVPVLTVRLRTE